MQMQRRLQMMIDTVNKKKVLDSTITTRPASLPTLAVHGRLENRSPQANNHALITPVFQTATYTFEDTADLSAFMEAKMWGGDPVMAERGEYGRYGNPTVRTVEKRLAALENGGDALLFPTGMSAITNVLLSMLSSGSHVIFTDDCYRKTRNFCQTFLKRLGIESTQVPMGDYEALEAAIQPNTRLLISESPTNPYLRVADLDRLTAIARRHRVKTMIDATFATPINQRPLDFGIDLVVHSATKYFSGHNDIMAGAVVGDAGLIHALRQGAVRMDQGRLVRPNGTVMPLPPPGTGGLKAAFAAEPRRLGRRTKTVSVWSTPSRVTSIHS
jgi:cystathionine gamma-synthase